jgi:glutathione synthase/RimK-type ligase-like ATP-grasp enzyme
MQDLEGFVSDDELAYGPLESLGWFIEAVPWNAKHIDWGAFEAVVIRTTWDYQKTPDTFLAILEQIQNSGVRVENSLDLVRWNINKKYLQKLDACGVPTVPTVWAEELGPIHEGTILQRLRVKEVVLKALVSANADLTYRLQCGSPDWSEAAAVLNQRGYLAQPFVNNIVSEGEYSLMYFDGQISHAVLKTPKPGDFRVQEEHGARIRTVQPSLSLIAAGARALAALDSVPLYARADFVRMSGEDFALMELELIEPSLYLRMDEGAAERFARAVDRRLRDRDDDS